MYKFRLWVRLNQLQTAHVVLHAATSIEAQQLGEAQYGRGMVLNTQQIND
jgi:hypothetical protein